MMDLVAMGRKMAAQLDMTPERIRQETKSGGNGIREKLEKIPLEESISLQMLHDQIGDFWDSASDDMLFAWLAVAVLDEQTPQGIAALELDD